MKRFKELMSLCEGSVMIEINAHKDYYDSVENHFRGVSQRVGQSILDVMIERDTIVHIQAYPHSPIASYSVYHYDLDVALDEILELVRSEFDV